ncbi:MAG: hypothetical protein RL693_2665 [Verrucomicrobiota bacterium]|jgi:hypothetical protein
MKPFVIIRWLLAVACSVFSVKLMIKGLAQESLAAAPFLIISFGSIIAAVLSIAPDTAFKIAEAFSGLFTGIFFPDDKFSKPPLSYLLARRYAEELRTEDAINEYINILHYYPREHDAYLELTALAKSTGHEKIYRQYYRKFHHRFPAARSVAIEGTQSGHS